MICFAQMLSNNGFKKQLQNSFYGKFSNASPVNMTWNAFSTDAIGPGRTVLLAMIPWTPVLCQAIQTSLLSHDICLAKFWQIRDKRKTKWTNTVVFVAEISIFKYFEWFYANQMRHKRPCEWMGRWHSQQYCNLRTTNIWIASSRQTLRSSEVSSIFQMTENARRAYLRHADTIFGGWWLIILFTSWALWLLQSAKGIEFLLNDREINYFEASSTCSSTVAPSFIWIKGVKLKLFFCNWLSW